MVTINDSFIINRTKFISSGFGDEIMLMNLETGDYVGLNIVSADIWRQAEKQITAQQIINYLMEQYNVEDEVCMVQVLSCLENMIEKELLIKI